MAERPYQRLVAWKEAHLLCLWVYQLTERFPADERFRLVDQMCRSSASVPTNVAEGSAKDSKKEQARYYETALCSLEELHYQFVLSFDLHYINEKLKLEANDHTARVGYLISRLRASCFR